MADEITTIADLYEPTVWIPGAREALATLPSILTSPAVQSDPLMDAIASGPGREVEIPFYKDITDTDDQTQEENTAPEKKKITSGLQVAPIMNRVTPFDSTALAAQVTGLGNPVQAVLEQLATLRAKQRQKTVVSILRGLFGTALNANQVSNFVEATASQNTDIHFIKSDYIFDAASVLGERLGAFNGCLLIAHSTIVGALRKQDETNFIPASQNGSLGLDTYKGCAIIYSDALVRAGTTSGLVFDTYLLGPGTIAWGEKMQSAKVGDVAHMVIKEDEDKNNVTLYDRTRFAMHVKGTKWVGSPAGQSATNAELATAGNWELAYSSANRITAARILTNG